jgi:hypothetical protein
MLWVLGSFGFLYMEVQLSLIDYYTIGQVGEFFIQADYSDEAEYQ